MIVCFLDIGGIVDHYCLKSVFVIINHERGLHFDEWFILHQHAESGFFKSW